MRVSRRSWHLWITTATTIATSTTTAAASAAHYPVAFAFASGVKNSINNNSNNSIQFQSRPSTFVTERRRRPSDQLQEQFKGGERKQRLPWISTRNSITASTRRQSITTTAMASSSSSSTEVPSSNSNSDSVRVALLQLEVSMNKHDNHQRVKEYVHRAAQQNVQLVVLPEIWNGPYATAAFGDYAEILPNVGDEYDKEYDDGNNNNNNNNNNNIPIIGESARLLQTLAREFQLWIVGGSISERVVEEVPDDDTTTTTTTKLYNTCLVINPQGQIVAKHRKVHLFDINVPGGISFQESDTLSPGQSLSWFDSPFGRIGIGICYDIRFPEYALALAQLTSSENTNDDDNNNNNNNNNKKFLTMLVYPGAFNLTTGPAHWELLQRARALDNQCYCLTASPARVTAEAAAAAAAAKETTTSYPHYTAWGHSTVVGPWGNVIATCDDGPALVIADLDLSEVTQIRQQIPILQQKRYDLYNTAAVISET